MQSKYGFTMMTIDEFENWIKTAPCSRKITILQVHHTYSPAYAQFTGSNHFSLQNGMKDYHVNGAGYADIAQNFTTFPDGMIMTGRSLSSAPAGCVGANTTGICVENLGNFDRGGDTMTQKQKDTIVRMYAAMCKRFGISPETGVRYHGWYTASGTYIGNYSAGRSCKTCPGSAFMGGCTRASYDKNFKPLINQAIAGKYGKEVDDEVVKKIKVFNCATGKEETVDAIVKNDGKGNTNYIKLRDMTEFGCNVGYGNGLPSIDAMPVGDVNVTLNGDIHQLKGVYRQSGTNFIGVRDLLEKVFGVPHDAIQWDSKTRTITINGRLDFTYRDDVDADTEETSEG